MIMCKLGLMGLSPEAFRHHSVQGIRILRDGTVVKPQSVHEIKMIDGQIFINICYIIGLIFSVLGIISFMVCRKKVLTDI